MRLTEKTAMAIVSLRSNSSFIEFVDWIAKRGEDNTKRAIYTDGDASDVAKGMARESIEIMKGIESAVSIIEKSKHIEE